MMNFLTNRRFTILGVFLCIIACRVEVVALTVKERVEEVSVACMMVYEEGGAPVVSRSPECPQWLLSPYKSSQSSIRSCHFVTEKGRRKYQEDRVTCDLDMKVPVAAKNRLEEVRVGIAAVFDGHGGDEASDMASRKLLDYFCINVVFNAYKRALHKDYYKAHLVDSSKGRLPVIDEYELDAILEEALLRTIQDIDREFSKEVLDSGYGYESGSTALVIVLVNGQALIANVGDSKAVLCSQAKSSQHEEGALLGVYAEELTRDHHPDREDEKARIEAAGGFVHTLFGVPRVNGVLAVSRSIGDLYLKRYGVTAEPEITRRGNFSRENNYLVIASDGVFETLSPQDVCSYLHIKSSPHCLSAAKHLIRFAYEKGSTDNLSAIAIDLQSITLTDAKETNFSSSTENVA